MKLLFTRNSPYARRIRMAIRHAHLLSNVEEIDVHPRDENIDQLLGAGPGGKVPVLVTDEGETLCESLVIANYLDRLAPGLLYPRNLARVTKVFQIESAASVLMDSLFTRSREQRREADEQSPGVITLEHERALRCYQTLDAWVPDLPESENLEMHGITTVAALGYADWRHPGDDWRECAPSLAHWYQIASQYPFAIETKPLY